MLGRYTTGPFCGGAEDSSPGGRRRTKPARRGAQGTIPPVKRLPLAVAVGALLVAVAGSALGWGAPSSGASPSASGAGLAAASPAPALAGSAGPSSSQPARSRPSAPAGGAPAPQPSGPPAPPITPPGPTRP